MASTKLSAEELKELLVELLSWQWPNGTIIEDINFATLFQMAALYPDPTQQESGSITTTCAVGDDNQGRAYDCANVEREAYLKSSLSSLLTGSNGTEVAKIHALLDEELRASRPDYKFNNKALVAKAAAIAESRATRGIRRLIHPPDYFQNQQKYEFAVVLFTLRAPDIGHPQQTRLFFNYRTPFHDFLSILQNETQLCTMPTENEHAAIFNASIPSPICAFHDPSHSTFEKHGSAFFEYVGTVREQAIQGSVSMTRPTTKSIIPRYRTRKGFTLDDGPWVYRFKLGQDEGGQSSYITDEASYEDMITKVRHSTKSTIVVVIHSIDRLRLQIIERKKRSAKLDGISQKKSIKGLYLEVDDDSEDHGERFLAYLERVSTGKDL